MQISSFIQNLITKAQQLNKTIVLPEGEDERVLQAAHYIAENRIANIILLGNEDDIKSYFSSQNWSLDDIQVINPNTSPKLGEYATLLYNMRKEKGMSEDEAFKIASDANYFGTLMIKSGHADGMVSGANHSTADTVRPALQIIKSARKDRGVSAVFIARAQDGKIYYLSDCALNINPTSQELAGIALSTADTALQFGDTPKVAMLSYSTYGSGKGESVTKVREATELAKTALQSEEYAGKNIILDGELQADAALDSIVSAKKAPTSAIKGEANVLIFPNIDAGNIGYKLLQRIGNAEMYGPLLQGLNAPINDLSRGCFTEDIIGAIAITILQTQK